MDIETYSFQQHGDDRGNLVALEVGKEVPFKIKRIYYMYGTGHGVRRGYHAHKKLKQILICVHGECRIHLDDGSSKKEIHLSKPYEGIFLKNNIWREMYGFSEDAVLLVLASELYDENDYIRDYNEFLKYEKYQKKNESSLYSQLKWDLYVKLLRHEWLYLFLKKIWYSSDKECGIGVNGRKIQVATIDDILRENKTSVLEEKTKRKVFIPEYYRGSHSKVEKFVSPEIFVSELEEVDVIGDQRGFIYKDQLVYDLYDKKSADRIDFRSSSILDVYRGCARVQIHESEENIASGIDLVGTGSENYYHITVEILSRLAYVDQFERYRNIPVLVDESVRDIPSMNELFIRVNRYDHPIIYVKKGFSYHVKNMIYISYNSWLPINVFHGKSLNCDYMIAESCIKNIRESVLRDTKVTPFRKIFISRENLTFSRLHNEKEVRELFASHGYEMIYPEKLTFAEQVRVFSEAKCVAASSGAALTNIIYCMPESTLVCIIPSIQKFYTYSTIAGIVGMRTVFLDAKVKKKTRHISCDEIELNLDYCADFLNHENME